ncbi:MAG: rhodanese-like domain-containing protein [Pseudomonadota bacterium]
MTPIRVPELAAKFSEHAEFALIDPREQGVFTRGHLLGASNLPVSRLELLIGKTVPRKATEIILCDDGDGAAAHARVALSALGYSDVKTLAGGVSAWAVSGYHVFTGVNIIGKAFGEYLEKSTGTPHITAEELNRRTQAGEHIYLLDSRTPGEHSNFCIPGALSCPNGEMVYRALPSAPPDATVVVHCAGRTRSILGAQTLIEAGLANQVVALENGTMDWHFAGLELERGADRPLAPPNPPDTERAQAAAASMAARAGINAIDEAMLETWRHAKDATLYLFDVRSPAEFAAGHIPGARSVPGGQLVQNVDRYMVTRNARSVLIDTEGVRAKASAFWLARMGYKNVHVLTAQGTKTSPQEAPTPLPENERITVVELENGQTCIVADIRTSTRYRRGHIPGAWFLTRAHLERDEANLPAGEIALVSDDAAYADLVARDLRSLGRKVRHLEGGMSAWSGATQKGLTALASVPDDIHVDPSDLDTTAQREREFRRYLDWEIGLIDMLEGDPAALWMR